MILFLAGVISLILWVSLPAKNAYSRDVATSLALEYLGPNFPSDWTDKTSPDINGNAYHWTHLLGIPFTDDIHIDLREVPLDLDVDGTIDVRVTRKIDLKGGVVANPEVFGIIPTPDDPKGTVGRYSISTGFFGIRESMDPQSGKGTGRIGFTCGACHAGLNPETGEVILGLTNNKLDWGLMVAGSRAIQPDTVIDINGDGAPDSEDYLRKRHRAGDEARLDPNQDGRVTIAEFREGLGFEPVQQIQARLLLAGPGRQDQSSEYGQDESVPGIMRMEYEDGVESWIRKPRPSIFNPISVPSHVGLAGVNGFNLSGFDSAVDIDYVERIQKLTGKNTAEISEWLGVSTTDRIVLNRAIALDKRNIETFSLNSDSWQGLEWSDVLSVDRDMTKDRFWEDIPSMFEARVLREIIAGPVPAEAIHPGLDPERVARGKEIFSRTKIGSALNQQLLYQPTPKFQEMGFTRGLYLSKIDPQRPLAAKIDVACASCHNYSPSTEMVPLREQTAVHGRCYECHPSHPEVRRRKIELSFGKMGDVESCLECHETHRDFGFQSYTRSFLLPFDADLDGSIRGDETDDGKAGGIGTDAMYLTNPVNSKLYYTLLDENTNPEKPGYVHKGFGWIRVSPLRAIFATAPYLHNGSVPTLEDLLLHPGERPPVFSVGNPSQDFSFDTKLPGNRNTGHDFGGDLDPEQRRDLVEFLKSL